MNTMSPQTERLLKRPDVRNAIRALVENRAERVILADGLTLMLGDSLGGD